MEEHNRILILAKIVSAFRNARKHHGELKQKIGEMVRKLEQMEKEIAANSIEVDGGSSEELRDQMAQYLALDMKIKIGSYEMELIENTIAHSTLSAFLPSQQFS